MIQAKQGKIETKNGKTYLVLKHADVNHVIMFSDRPYHIVKTITGNALQILWKVGNDSFEKDPPNAISSAGQKAQIVILNGVTVTDTTAVFPISSSQDEENVSAKLAMQRVSDNTQLMMMAIYPQYNNIAARRTVRRHAAMFVCAPITELAGAIVMAIVPNLETQCRRTVPKPRLHHST